MTPATRSRLAAMLAESLNTTAPREMAEQAAAALDRGIGVAAVTAIVARDGDAAKDVEAAKWARRAAKAGRDVCHVFFPGMTEAEADATARFVYALEIERRRP